MLLERGATQGLRRRRRPRAASRQPQVGSARRLARGSRCAAPDARDGPRAGRRHHRRRQLHLADQGAGPGAGAGRARRVPRRAGQAAVRGRARSASARAASCATPRRATARCIRSRHGSPRSRVGASPAPFPRRSKAARATSNFSSVRCAMGDTQALDIARLGAQGDGIADTAVGPGVRALCARGRARAGRCARRARAPHRRHRGEPGAHRARVPPLHPLRRLRRAAPAHARLSGVEARARRGGLLPRAASTRRSATWRPSASVPRRRASFSARRTGRGVVLGFHEAKGRRHRRPAGVPGHRLGHRARAPRVCAVWSSR